MAILGVPNVVSTADEILDVARAAVDRDAQALIESEHEITCRAGCSACCSQAVPVTSAEVRAIREYVNAQDSSRRADFNERIGTAVEQLHGAGLTDEVPPVGDPARAGFVSRYFQANVPCPMLEPDGTCGVRPVRPLACREYLVASDPAHCSTLNSPQVVRLRARRDVLIGFHKVSTAFGEPLVDVLAIALARHDAPPAQQDRLSGPGLVRLLTSTPVALP